MAKLLSKRCKTINSERNYQSWSRISHHIPITMSTNLWLRIKKATSSPMKKERSLWKRWRNYNSSKLWRAGRKSWKSLWKLYLSLLCWWRTFLSDPGSGYQPSSRISVWNHKSSPHSRATVSGFCRNHRISAFSVVQQASFLRLLRQTNGTR